MIGSYRLVRKLGEGGMGAVYLGEHALLGRLAAIKVLLPSLSDRSEIVARFFNEARATTSICDPGIVQIFDFGHHTDGSAYIVMEYLEGEGLDQRLARLGRLGASDALRLCRQLATSLAAAHARDIVHRDLKPENIFLIRDPEVASGERAKILDFGIAKLSADHPGKIRTHTGALMGTPIYMSPEQCRGAGELDHRSDIYALGCVLFHLIVGAPPFDRDGIGEIIAAHMLEPPPAPSTRCPHLAPGVDEIVLRCLAKSPDDRFQTMQELAGAMDRLLARITAPDSATMAIPAPIPAAPNRTPTTLGSSAGQVSTPPPTRPRRLGVAAAALVIVASAATAIVFVARRGDPAAPPLSPPVALPSIDAAVVTAQVPDAPPAIDAAPDAEPDAPPDAAIAAAPDAAIPQRPHHVHRPPPRPGSPAPAPAPASCDRSIDSDCDGIPDVR